MPDAVFADPRLAAIYDELDADRRDLQAYIDIVEELGARCVVDVGCGTGTLAVALAARGLDVVGVDPAMASLEVARDKPGADRVRWVPGEAADLPPASADVAVMTGNVAQVFLEDEAWLANLTAIRRAVRPGATLVFETRVPARRAWEGWVREATLRTVQTESAGEVETWTDLLDVCPPLVTFQHTFHFVGKDEMLTSSSTLRFRERDEIEAALTASGWAVTDVRDAPDRPAAEYVFLAEATGAVQTVAAAPTLPW